MSYLVYSIIPLVIFIIGFTVKFYLYSKLAKKTNIALTLKQILIKSLYIICISTHLIFLISIYNTFVINYFIMCLILSCIFTLLLIITPYDIIKLMIKDSGVIYITVGTISTLVITAILMIGLVSIFLPAAQIINTKEETITTNISPEISSKLKTSLKVDMSDFITSENQAHITIYYDKTTIDNLEIPEKLSENKHDFKIFLNEENNNYLNINKFTTLSNLKVYKDDTKNILEKVSITYELHIDKSHLTFNTN